MLLTPPMSPARFRGKGPQDAGIPPRTDLRNREIVLSKLLSRFAHLTLFLFTGVPILSLLQFLAASIQLVIAGFGFTAVTMVGIGGMSILNSVIYKRPPIPSHLLSFSDRLHVLVDLPLSVSTAAAFGPRLRRREWTPTFLNSSTRVISSCSWPKCCIPQRGTLAPTCRACWLTTRYFGQHRSGVRGVACCACAHRPETDFARVKLSQQAKDRPPSASCRCCGRKSTSREA